MQDLVTFCRTTLAMLMMLAAIAAGLQLARTLPRLRQPTLDQPLTLQALLVTIVGACFYLGRLVEDPTRFPDVPQSLLLVLGGSHAAQLIGQQRESQRRVRVLRDRLAPLYSKEQVNG